MVLFKEKNIYDFMKMRYMALSFSAILIIASIFLLITKGLNLGIDFSGGTLVQLRYEKPVVLKTIRQALLANKQLKNVSVSKFGSDSEIIVRFASSNADINSNTSEMISKLLANTGSFEVRRVDVVGPKVGDELRSKGLMALVVSIIATLIYLAFRFEWRFAVAAVLSVTHDVIITVGAISLVGFAVNLDTLAAVLTVIGYSLNDTIIVFDRIREGIKGSKESKLNLIINESISFTLSRTVITSALTIITVLVLFFFGGSMIHGFSFAMLVGLVIGTFSSIFIASPSLLWFRFSVANYRAKEVAKAKAKKEKEKMRSMYEKGAV